MCPPTLPPRFGTLLLLAVLAGVPATPVGAQLDSAGLGTSVLVDVSRSMRFRGNWQASVRESVQDLLFGGRLDNRVWQTDGVLQGRGEAFLAELRAGRPLYELGEPLLMLSFGQITGEYPYFRDLDVQSFDALDGASQYYQARFPTDFDDPWTYLGLAKAVERDEMRGAGRRRWHRVLISDVDSDQPDTGAQVDEAADSLASAYETTVNEQALVTFTYSGDRRLKLRIYEVVDPSPAAASVPGPAAGPGSPTDAVGALRLLVPANGTVVERVDGRRPLQFRWRAEGGADRYTFVLRDRAGKEIQRISSSRALVARNEPLPRGTYRWTVEARQRDGNRAVSETRTFQVKGSGGLGGLLVLLLIMGVGAAYYFLRRSASRRKPIAQG